MTLSLPEEHPTEKRPVLPSDELARESLNPKELNRVHDEVASRPLHASSPVMEQDNPPVPLPDSLQPTLFSLEEIEMPLPTARAAAHAEPQPVVNAASQPVAHAASQPTTHAASQPVAHAAPQPVAQPQASNFPQERSPRIQWVLAPEPEPQPIVQIKDQAPGAQKRSPSSAASGGYLARPSNIYAEEPVKEKQSSTTAADSAPKAMPEHITPLREPSLPTAASDLSSEDDASPDMQLVFRDTDPTADEPGAHQTHSISVPNSPVEEPAPQDDTDDLKRRAAERINKLRNLSFNVNAADPNNEFETVPAYIRRNLELYNTISNVENFYSNYEVKTDENNNTEISTINTFLDGKRPD